MLYGGPGTDWLNGGDPDPAAADPYNIPGYDDADYYYNSVGDWAYPGDTASYHWSPREWTLPPTGARALLRRTI